MDFHPEGVQIDWEFMRFMQNIFMSLAGCPTAAGLCLAAVGKSICLF